MTAQPGKLLIVDDDRLSRTALAGQLADSGCSVHQADDGLTGLERTRELRPDVVLCDWVMPGMDGLAYCAAVRADPALRGTYVTLLSARGNPGERVAGLDAGADDYLVKPVEPAELQARVRAGLRLRRMQLELAAAGHAEALLQMATMIGHEINNPLTALFGHLELLLLYVARNDREGIRHHVRQAGEVAARIANVGQRLVTLQNPQTRNYLGGKQMLDLRRSASGEESAVAASTRRG